MNANDRAQTRSHGTTPPGLTLAGPDTTFEPFPRHHQRIVGSPARPDTAAVDEPGLPNADRVATGGFQADIARAGPGIVVVSLAGRVDSATTHVLAAALAGAAAADACGRIVLELNRVTVLNARGLGVIVAAHEYARRSGGAVVVVVDQVAPAAVSLQLLQAGTRPVTYPTLTAALTAPARS